MTVSVIIVTYNTRQMTSECINSIFEKTKGIDFEIILVDNASTDGSKEFFEHDQRIKYIYSNENLGFGKGNNLGYKHASGKYIFLLNSDTLLINDAITEMYRFLEKESNDTGCVGCVLQNHQEEIIHSYHINFPTLSWFFQEVLCYSIPKFWNPYKRDIKKRVNDKFPLTVAQITGADMFIRKEVIEECGLFDPDFFMYYEETEMQHRFFEHGYKSVIINTPKIIHLVGASSNRKKNFLQKYNRILNGRYTYAKKVLNRPQHFLFRLMHLLMIPRIIVSLSNWKEKKKTLGLILGK